MGVDRQKLADMVTEFATDETYESFPSLRAMIAAQVSNKIGKLADAERIEVWKLISPEHQATFKKYLAIAEEVDAKTYPKQEKIEDIFERIKARNALKVPKNEPEPATVERS